MFHTLLKTSLFLFIIALTSCSNDEPVQTTPTKIRVFADNQALGFFAQRIGGEYVEVETPPVDQEGDWQPSLDEIIRIQSSDLILLSGAGYAKWAKRASLPASRTRTLSDAQRDRWIEEVDETAHAHGPEGEHTHTITASYTWADPEIAINLADSLRSALVEIRPVHQEEFRSNLRILQRDIQTTSADVERAINAQPSQPILFSRPIYQYMQRRFRMNGQSVYWSPTEMPSEDQWSSLEELLTEHPAEFMIWPSEPNPEIAKRLQEMNISSVVYDPTGIANPEENLLVKMKAGTKGLAEVYGLDLEP